VHDVVDALRKDSQSRRSSLTMATTSKAKKLWSKFTGKSNGLKKQWSSTSDLTNIEGITKEINPIEMKMLTGNVKISEHIRRRFSQAQFDKKGEQLRRRSKSQFIPPEQLKALQDDIKVS
jgi:hypothetical protein